MKTFPSPVLVFAAFMAVFAGSAPLLPAATPDLLSNPSFASGMSGWKVETNLGGLAASDLLDSAEGRAHASRTLRIIVLEPGNENWGVQLVTDQPFAVLAGRRYKLSFEAKANQEAWSYVQLQRQGGDFARVGEGKAVSFKPANVWARHEVTFTADRDVPQTRLVLGSLGQRDAIFWIANVSLTEL